ncbi:MAG: PA14 domain-containing protein [Steroidobacteraceae bacterium]|nr:PA14 domain-containing protein [Steroidobacteraceae bacterium]
MVESTGVRRQAGASRAFVRALACVALSTAAAPGLADNVRGAWSPVHAWPLIAVHAVLMPDGRVLTYGTDGAGKQTGYFVYDVWDPSLGTGPDSHLTLPNMTLTDIFCGSQLVLPEGGGVFLAGGDNWTGTGTTNTGNNDTNVFSIGANTLARGADMNRARWYSSATTLLDGEIYIQGGSSGTDRPEIRGIDGQFRLLPGADTSALQFQYPRNWIAPDGRVFGYDSNGRVYYVNPAGTGSITQLGQLLPTANRGSDATAVMFRPGRILQAGGASNGALVIDIRGASPTFTATQSMGSQRRLANATVLADGKVVVTGGSAVWNQMTNVAYTADIWNPDTGTWTQGAAGVRARLYHSNALLMPDATVLVAGGGAPGPQVNTNAEIYYPPYLFDSNGQRAARPSIANAPATVQVGETFFADWSGANAIARVTLVRTGSGTHGWNMDQRFTELTFQVRGNRLAIQAPTRASDAPPGFYMLFAIDSAGVPSVAAMVQVGVAPHMNPAITPVLQDPGSRSGLVGLPVSFALVASDPNGDVLGYAASGLPPGVSIDPATGVIAGQPTVAGSYDVVVAASDGLNAATARFLWTLTEAAALGLEPPPPSTPTLASGEASFAATAVNGINARYRWTFGDGTPTTAWSDSPAARHRFAAPGIYYVRVDVTDDRGAIVSETLVHAVHLPATPRAPSMSSSLVARQPATGNPQAWVVNADNNSVSVLDVVARTRLAEITVGTAPRSLAVAPDGRIWVANKQSGSISVIDPSTYAVVRTIGLPRASQPYGIAFRPGSNTAYVALAATGQLLRYDSATFARTGTLEVGANVRHLAVGADGAKVYVSRFITPPLPGESTTDVQPGDAGGEVVVVDAASFAVQRTVTLRASSKPDFENQGRGVPNYLGAVAISPDGTQAWVPSKQDNVQRGLARDGRPLDFQNTVRAISSRIDLATDAEDHAARLDHDNSSRATAAVYDRRGNYLFVALETSREVAVVDAHGRWEMFRFDVGRAPQALALSPDGLQLWVSNFMDRSVGVFDLAPLLVRGVADVPAVTTLNAVGTERLAATVLAGKRLFYDARDPRLARDAYMSCASCHDDGGHDGRTWDLTGFGEGLRNTISLRGRAAGHGFLHWSNNFDEVQDFEGQIRGFAGGTGLMSDAAFFAGTRSQPLGERKAGQSADLDALAAYVASLNRFDDSPHRVNSTTLTPAGSEGRALFQALDCASCHAGTAFSASGVNTLLDVGTVEPSSGRRLGAPLAGIDPPTLRDVWATAPYLHDGSAATLGDAIRAHGGAATLPAADVDRLVAYLRQVGREEAAAPQGAGTGSGLVGRYFSGTALAGAPLLTRTEAVDFAWGTGSPGAGVPTDRFSVRWSGTVEAPASGTYRFQTVSDDGVRLWVNGVPLVANWTLHGATTDTSATITLQAGQRYEVRLEYFENTGNTVMRLRWQTPGNATFVTVPANRLYAD